MRNDPGYFMPEYACHESNAIVRNYVETNRYERANPSPNPESPISVSPAVADALEGRWSGTPRIVTLDLAIEIEFMQRSDGTMVGQLIGTSLGEINQPLGNVSFADGVLRFELPNWQPWGFAGVLTEAGTITGAVNSAQGGVPVTFRRTSLR
jgi:hypothetical protein